MDDNGYPEEEDLTILDTFNGTPHSYVDYLRQLVDPYGGIQVEENVKDAFLDRKVNRIKFITGGWSGNEEILARISGSGLEISLFYMRYWQSTHRGGLVIFEVPVEAWEQPTFLGLLRLIPTEV